MDWLAVRHFVLTKRQPSRDLFWPGSLYLGPGSVYDGKSECTTIQQML